MLASLSEAMTTGDHDDRFGFGIDLLIAGLAAYADGRMEIRKPEAAGPH